MTDGKPGFDVREWLDKTFGDRPIVWSDGREVHPEELDPDAVYMIDEETGEISLASKNELDS